MSRRVLITGGSGFVGQWLSRLMLEEGALVFAGSIEGRPAPGVLSPSELGAIQWLPLDVSSSDETTRAVVESAPEAVVHLAGIAFPPDANADPMRTYDVNTLGALRLLQALSAAGSAGNKRPRVLVVGTAEQYGPHADGDFPLKESAALRPVSAYAGSKAAQELLALQAGRTTNLDVICTRSFNHSGAGHGADYLLPALVRRALPLTKGGGTLALGNGAPVRDYLHVADVVSAYALLLQRGESGEIYNVCSGRGITVKALAERVLQRLGVSAAIVEDPTLVRPSDIPVLIGDNTKLKAATGWAPRRSIDDIIDDLIHAASR